MEDSLVKKLTPPDVKRPQGRVPVVSLRRRPHTAVIRYEGGFLPL